QLLADGLSYAEVADRLVLSEKTVGHHVSAVLRKLGEPPRSRAGAAAMRLGGIAPRKRQAKAKEGGLPHVGAGPAAGCLPRGQSGRAGNLGRGNPPWHCSWTRTRSAVRSPWTTWPRPTPPTCRPRTLTAFITCATGWTRTAARSSAWSTPRTRKRRPRCTARRTGSSRMRSTRSPRAPDRVYIASPRGSRPLCTASADHDLVTGGCRGSTRRKDV